MGKNQLKYIYFSLLRAGDVKLSTYGKIHYLNNGDGVCVPCIYCIPDITCTKTQSSIETSTNVTDIHFVSAFRQQQYSYIIQRRTATRYIYPDIPTETVHSSIQQKDETAALQLSDDGSLGKDRDGFVAASSFRHKLEKHNLPHRTVSVQSLGTIDCKQNFKMS